MHRLIGAKFCTVISTRSNFITPVQNFGEPTPQRNLWAKNMQSLVRFWTTLKFGGEYLRKGWRYSQSDKCVIDSDSSRVRREKYGELWSTNYGDLDVESYPPKSTFSENHISAARGAAPQIFTRVREWPSLTSPPPTGTGPPYIFFKEL